MRLQMKWMHLIKTGPRWRENIFPFYLLRQHVQSAVCAKTCLQLGATMALLTFTRSHTAVVNICHCCNIENQLESLHV